MLTKISGKMISHVRMYNQSNESAKQFSFNDFVFFRIQTVHIQSIFQIVECFFDYVTSAVKFKNLRCCFLKICLANNEKSAQGKRFIATKKRKSSPIGLLSFLCCASLIDATKVSVIFRPTLRELCHRIL